MRALVAEREAVLRANQLEAMFEAMNDGVVVHDKQGHIAQVSVRDEGPGLLSAEQERIWERYYRMPDIEVQSGSGVGRGVGLNMCRTIIEQHGGHVGVDSRPGEGSTFWFTLPLAKHGSMDEETVV